MTEGKLDGAAAANLFGIPRAGDLMKVAASLVGVRFQLSWSDRYLAGIQDGRGCTLSHSHG